MKDSIENFATLTNEELRAHIKTMKCYDLCVTLKKNFKTITDLNVGYHPLVYLQGNTDLRFSEKKPELVEFRFSDIEYSFYSIYISNGNYYVDYPAIVSRSLGRKEAVTSDIDKLVKFIKMTNKKISEKIKTMARNSCLLNNKDGEQI